MKTTYYTLLVRSDRNQPWEIHFGDYSRAVAMQERDDVVDGGEVGRNNTCVITTGDQQDEINAAVRSLNNHV